MVSKKHFEKAQMDGEVHYLEENTTDEFLSFILCFPKTKCSHYDKRLLLLKKQGFDYILEAGTNVFGYRIIGKGYSSIVVLAHQRLYGLGVLKIRRLDSRRSSLGHEGMILDYLDKTLLVPQLYWWNNEFIFMEYLDPRNCLSIEKALTNNILSKNKRELARLLKKTMVSLYLIDMLNIDHGELNRPYNHIYICFNDHVKIIDWESSGYRKPHNLTMFMSFLMYRYRYREKLMELLELNIDEITSFLRRYKKTLSIIELLPLIRSLEPP